MISLYSDGRSFQYLYHEETGIYLFLQKNKDKCEEGTCPLKDFFSYRENCWEDFKNYWTPQELIEFVERHMKHD